MSEYTEYVCPTCFKDFTDADECLEHMRKCGRKGEEA